MMVALVVGPRICGAGKAKCRDCNDGDAEIFQDHFRFLQQFLFEDKAGWK
jgi:hypothetical protein